MMYSKIDPDTEFEARSKKKYELSLKRSKQALSNRDGVNFQRGTAMLEALKISDESSDLTDSQNIELRVSDSFLVQDTQEKEKLDVDVKNFGKEEVILISDSSEDETSKGYEWTRLKTREFERHAAEGVSHHGAIYTIRSSESEEENGRRHGGSFCADPSRRRSSMYTSDETFSEATLQKFHNKENLLRSRLNPMPEKSVVPDSDESIFSFDKMRGVLTDNRRNIGPAVSARVFEKTNGKRDAGRSPANERAPGDRAERIESLKETNRRIEELRRTPELSKESMNESGSPKKSMEIQRQIGESRRRRAIGENKAGSANKSMETNKRITVPDKTPELSKNETGSLNKLKETYKRMEALEKTPPLSRELRIDTGSLNDLRSQRTPECATIAHAQTGSLSNRKETSGNSEKSRDTRQLLRTAESASSRNLQETPGQTEEARGTLLSAKKSSSRTILSKRDVRKILRVVKSKRAVYQPPEDYRKPRNSDDSEIDDGNDDAISSADSKASSKNVRDTENAVVIAETDSDTEDEIIRGSKVDLSRPYKTHVTRFLDPAANIETTPDGMSRSKQLEIAHWLMTNSPAATGESSISNVSASNKYSLSSGNSSLERLEMEYETPNNRDKLRKLHNEEKRKCKTNSMKSRQTTIDNFVKRSDDGTKKMLTPVPVTTRKKVSPEGGKLSENLGIEDCADILDNLYGNVWRSKANDLLPLTEPRKKNILLRDKGVQTERKVNARSKRVTKSSDTSSQEDGFDTFVRNIKPNLNSTKKPAKRPDRERFIKDSSSSSESSGETTYLTALTNPRVSNDRKINNRHPPLAPNVQRAIAICDSETDDEDEKLFDNRKVLSFSEDESDSNTSEYDPINVIPVKTTTKTPGGTTISRNATKPPKIPISATNSRTTKPKSNFLESLSASIALEDAHPDAKKYRQDFKNTKEELCKYLYKLYNEKIFDNKLPSDMAIEWNVRMRGTAGFCYNKRSVKALGGVTRSSRIVLATKILDTPDRLRDTLVHEMCHAAAWLINDVSDGHGPFWKGWAAKASKAFPDLPPIKRCHDYKITTKFTYRCTGCGYSVGRHSKSLDVDRKRCGHCYGKFELLINKVTKSGKVESKTPVTKKPSAFALFVKENYSTVKKNRKGVPHKEVMQILGQQFSAIKISKKNNPSDENNSVSGD